MSELPGRNEFNVKTAGGMEAAMAPVLAKWVPQGRGSWPGFLSVHSIQGIRDVSENRAEKLHGGLGAAGGRL